MKVNKIKHSELESNPIIVNEFKLMKIDVYQCNKCKQWIYSRARHDMKYCKCRGFGVDGGHYDDGWVCERLIGLMSPESKTVELELTERELYDDWNTSKDKYGVYDER